MSKYVFACQVNRWQFLVRPKRPRHRRSLPSSTKHSLASHCAQSFHITAINMALATSLSNLILSQSPSSAQSMHPETGKPNNPPPGLGSFVHYNVAEFSHILPQHMVEKGGLFLAMYRKFSQRSDVFSLTCCCVVVEWEACVAELLKQVALRYAHIRRWRQRHHWRAHDS
jgi:hypothetical protein